MENRYVIFPGVVRSKRDGDWHYVTARELSHLYGISLHKCTVVAGRDSIGFRPRKGDILLTVQYSGDYTLPKPYNPEEEK